MEQWQQWFQEKQIDRTLTALKKNNFEALFVPNATSAVEEVMKRIPEGAKVGVGGSVTLNQIGVIEALRKRNIQLIWPFIQAKNEEEQLELIRRSFGTDVFLTGTNAITEDGKLFNVDATGNRVGAMLVGPTKVIVVAGVNKIVKDIVAAEERLKGWTGPQNARRLNRPAPFDIDGGELDPVGLADFPPPFTELPAPDHQRPIAFRKQVRYRGFHGTGPGGGKDEHLVLRLEQGLETLSHVFKDFLKLRFPVVHDGLRHLQKDSRRKHGRPR